MGVKPPGESGYDKGGAVLKDPQVRGAARHGGESIRYSPDYCC